MAISLRGKFASTVLELGFYVVFVMQMLLCPRFDTRIMERIAQPVAGQEQTVTVKGRATDVILGADDLV